MSAITPIEDPTPVGVEYNHAQEFFDRLCAAARQDGRALDPLFHDLAMDSEANDPVQEKEAKEGFKEEWTVGSAYYTTQLVLTGSAEQDRKLQRLFRKHFPDLDVQQVSEASLVENKQTWNALLEEAGNDIDGPKIPTLLRKDCLDMFWMPNEEPQPAELLLVPRYQFLIYEICRIHQGLYGKSFRRVLEVFDLKTQADRLENIVEEPEKSEEAMDALRFLRNQWPTPSKSALKTTQVVSLIQRGCKSGSTEVVRTTCQQLLNYWKSLKNLEEISGLLQGGGEQYKKLQPSLERAGEAMINENEPNNDNVASSAQEVTKNAATVADFLENLAFSGPKDPTKTTEVFREFGVVVLADMMPTLEECMLQATQSFEALIEEHLEPRGLSMEGADRFELPMVRQLQGHRVDNQYKLLDNTESPIARLGRQLQQEIPLLLCYNGENNFKLDSAGVIHCLPPPRRSRKDDNTVYTEPWHSEGSTLFANAHHDAHCFNIFIPLSDLSDENGAMEFIPGSHVDEVYHEVAPGVAELADKDPDAQHELAVRANVAAGTMLVVDSRLCIRGLSNKAKQTKQILYFKFSKDWFQKQEEGRQKSFRREMEIHSKLLIASRLFQLVSGISSPQLPSIEEPIGHAFYTCRFDLLLLEDLISEDEHLQSTAMANIAGIVHFCKLSEGDKEIMARQFVYCLSESAYYRRAKILRRIRGKRQKHNVTKDNGIDSVTIVPGTAEAAALADLTAAIIVEESTLLSKLGFTSDQSGIAILLAMLKAHALRNALGSIGVTASRLEESFTMWWYAREGRFTFFPAVGSSDKRDSNSTVLVIFSGLDSRHKIQKWNAVVTAAKLGERMDILHVLDPAFSCFCQDPSGSWDGCNYYFSEIAERTSMYKSVVFLGESLGGAAALRFSSLATTVLAFSPQIDLAASKTIRRTDFPWSIKKDFKEKVLEEVKRGDTAIFVHYAKHCKEQSEQVHLLPKRSDVEYFEHQYSEVDLCSHLIEINAMSAIVENAITFNRKSADLSSQ